MIEQPDSPSVSDTKKQVFDHYLYRLQSEIHTILSAEDGHESRIQNLENELNVFKKACFSSEAEKKTLTEEVAALREKVEQLESAKNVPENRLACVIDGNRTQFSSELMSKGIEGGQLAAKQLSESIQYHLTPEYPFPLWVYIFYDKACLSKPLSKTGKSTTKSRSKLEEFVAGFNRFSERFVMIDVVSEENAVRSKVEAHLEYLSRSQETVRVVFGGCQDNQYAAQLHSLLHSFKEKLVLLQGTSDMVPEIESLQLPSLVIPDLFVSQNQADDGSLQACALSARHSTTSYDSSSLSSPPSSPSDASSNSSRALTTPPPPPYNDHEHSGNSAGSINGEQAKTPLAPRSLAADKRPIRVILGNVSGPVSYRPMPQHWPHASSEDNERSPLSAGSSTGTPTRYRRLIPGLALSQHNPPPCTLHYLASSGCRHGANCRFGHDYILDDDDIERLSANAKRIPCPAVNNDDICAFGDLCCYGHECPFNSRCHFYRLGRCKFTGALMHSEPMH